MHVRLTTCIGHRHPVVRIVGIMSMLVGAKTRESKWISDKKVLLKVFFIDSTVGQNQVNLFRNCFLLKNAWKYPLVVIFLHCFPFGLFFMLFKFLFTLGLFYYYK